MAVLPQPFPWDIRESTDLPEEVQRYLADTEVNALGGQKHWAVMIEPVVTTVVGVLLCFWLIARIPTDLGPVRSILAVSIIVFIGRLAWLWLEWRINLIFITGKRIIYVHGFITRNVSMMPLSKLTDMRYVRTPVGQVLDYGTFIVESAGQVQALSKLSPIPDPDASYRHVQNLLFGRATQDVRLVDVTAEKQVKVSWGRGVWRRTSDTGGTMEQDDDSPWWTS